MAEKKVIKMHFPVSFVREYMLGWAKTAKKEAKNEQERAIVDDVITMICIASEVMIQQPNPKK